MKRICGLLKCGIPTENIRVFDPYQNMPLDELKNI